MTRLLLDPASRSSRLYVSVEVAAAGRDEQFLANSRTTRGTSAGWR
jgi:hypothetical protein